MLATLTDQRFSDPGWLFERKLDGVRALAVRDGDPPELWSRNHKTIGASYPELVAELERRGPDRFVADGEIVAFEGNQTSFARLQARIHLTDAKRIAATGVNVYYYLFDLLHLDGQDLTGLPLRDRKRLLRRAFDFGGPLRSANHRDTEGEEYFRTACASGWEGLIAKRADAPYRSGRSTDWLKFKCVAEQELVVGGFTDPHGSRQEFGALLVGYYADGRFRYAGKVGTGYTERTLRMLRSRLDGLATDTSPFADRVAERAVHWVRPELVAQIGFTEWTGDGRLRHPRYLGLREDKSPTDVVRETAQAR
ncbi:MAG TPA: non-homologous end-joining DNA ligase [Pseudonocardiaceae bacterium]|nr:non-homologous end-joining DNA ligase [Pseudonocardiaceae bacterium]